MEQVSTFAIACSINKCCLELYTIGNAKKTQIILLKLIVSCYPHSSVKHSLLKISLRLHEFGIDNNIT